MNEDLIELVPVAGSTNIEGVGWQGEGLNKGTLVIQFKGGRKYAYRGVPEDDYEGILQAASPGDYVNSYIKPNYSYERI